MIEINIPAYARAVIDTLLGAGYEAYCVGGCVRDSILGRPVNDWDITTSATPDEMMSVFSHFYCVPTGLKHGTVTVVSDGRNIEITTFRTDGEYSDNRHPDKVEFSRNLSDDLSRRDFTVNAMCWNPRDGFVDLFGGLGDLENRIIRAVGNADERFREDGLRIMRAIRFASQLGFEIEKETSDAVLRNRALLKNISRERVFAELVKLVCGENAPRILSEYAPVIFEIIPELGVQYKHAQKGKKHAYDIWEHTCHTVGGTENDRILRLTMLLHDCGKAATETFDENGNSVFKNHAAVGGEIARGILKSLKADNNTLNTVSFLVSVHDMKVPKDKITVKRYLRDLGPENFLRLMKIRKADRGALADGFNDISDLLADAYAMYDEVMANGECFSLPQLCVTGKDIARLGFSGEEIGEKLNEALDAVIEERIPNEKAAVAEMFGAR